MGGGFQDFLSGFQGGAPDASQLGGTGAQPGFWSLLASQPGGILRDLIQAPKALLDYKLAQAGTPGQALNISRVEEAAKRAALESSIPYQLTQYTDPRINAGLGLPTTPLGGGPREEDLDRLASWILPGGTPEQIDAYKQMLRQTWHPSGTANLPAVAMTPELARSYETQAQTSGIEAGLRLLQQYGTGGPGASVGGIPLSSWGMRLPGGLTLGGTTERVPGQPNVPAPATPGPVPRPGGDLTRTPAPDRTLDATSRLPAHQRVQLPAQNPDGSPLGGNVGQDGTTIVADDGSRWTYVHGAAVQTAPAPSAPQTPQAPATPPGTAQAAPGAPAAPPTPTTTSPPPTTTTTAPPAPSPAPAQQTSTTTAPPTTTTQPPSQADLDAAQRRLQRLNPANQVPGQAPGAGGAIGYPSPAPVPAGAPGGTLAGQQLAQVFPGERPAQTTTPTTTPGGTTTSSTPGRIETPEPGGGKSYENILAAAEDPRFADFKKQLLERYSPAQGNIGNIPQDQLLHDPEALATGRMWDRLVTLEDAANKEGITMEMKEQMQRDLAKDAIDVLTMHFQTATGYDAKGNPITALSVSNPSAVWAALAAAPPFRLLSHAYLGPGGIVPPGGLTWRALQGGPYGEAAERLLMAPVYAIPIARAFGTSGRINQTELNRIQDYVLPNSDTNLAENQARMKALIQDLSRIAGGSGAGVNAIRQKYGLDPLPGAPGSDQPRTIQLEPRQPRIMGATP